MKRAKQFGACILAAGFSSRMGKFKPLLPLGDKTVIERILTVSKAAGIEKIAVVTGYNREALLPVIHRYSAIEAFNDVFEQGMFSSVQKGVAALPADLDGFFVMPVDCPLVSESVLRELMEHFEPDRFAVPCYRGKKGHPLLVPAMYRDDILGHNRTGGLKTITDRYFEKMKRIPVEHEGVVMDMDTPQAYEEIKSYLNQGCRSENLAELARGRRFILIRHGQIRQHKEKIFLGQTDVPLSHKGREQAENAGNFLAGFDFHAERMYTSDLQRAVQTAEIIQSKNNCISELISLPGLREMNLGPWDGKFISDIKRMFPEEYEKRGKNIMTYKMGHESENFFDLQYRVCKTVAGILKKDKNRDILITAHSGVLRSLCSSLRGGDVSDSWEPIGWGEVRIEEIN